MTILFEGNIQHRLPLKELPAYVSQRTRKLKSQTVHSAIIAGCISFGGSEVNEILDKGQYVKIWLPYSKSKAFEPYPINLDIVFEDLNTLVINKPAGLAVHQGLGDHHKTLLNALLANFPETFNVAKLAHALPHRLDKDTSGLIVISKNKEAYHWYTHLFANRQIKKTYLAVVEAIFPDVNTLIDAAIGRIPGNDYDLAVSEDAQFGKQAQTHVLTLHIENCYTLFQCTPLTGRTHQIRLHLAHFFAPILGDKRYGNKAEGLPMHLHAHKLTLKLFNANSETCFISPLPKDWTFFVEVLANL